MGGLCRKIEPDSVSSMLSLTRSLLRPYALQLHLTPPPGYIPECLSLPGNQGLDRLAILLLQAYLASVGPEGRSRVSFKVGGGGGGGGGGVLLKGCVLLPSPPPPLSEGGEAGFLEGAVLKAAVFSCSLTLKGLGVDETRSDAVRAFKLGGEAGANPARLLRLGEVLCQAGVRVVFCQRQVDARLAAMLGRRGVRVVHRLGVAKVGDVGRVVGVRVCGDYEELLGSGLGGVRVGGDLMTGVVGTCRLEREGGEGREGGGGMGREMRQRGRRRGGEAGRGLAGGGRRRGRRRGGGGLKGERASGCLGSGGEGGGGD
jgi:hypothetical protein